MRQRTKPRYSIDEPLFDKCERLIKAAVQRTGKAPDELWVSPEAYADLERIAGAKVGSGEALFIDLVRIVAHPKVVRQTVLVMVDV
jgi:hypothetical protein